MRGRSPVQLIGKRHAVMVASLGTESHMWHALHVGHVLSIHLLRPPACTPHALRHHRGNPPLQHHDVGQVPHARTRGHWRSDAGRMPWISDGSTPSAAVEQRRAWCVGRRSRVMQRLPPYCGGRFSHRSCMLSDVRVDGERVSYVARACASPSKSVASIQDTDGMHSNLVKSGFRVGRLRASTGGTHLALLGGLPPDVVSSTYPHSPRCVGASGVGDVLVPVVLRDHLNLHPASIHHVAMAIQGTTRRRRLRRDVLACNSYATYACRVSFIARRRSRRHSQPQTQREGDDRAHWRTPSRHAAYHAACLIDVRGD